jgi:hypothetical protein
VVSKPSADSFAVGRRQKALKSFLDSLTICDKVASGNKRRPRCRLPGVARRTTEPASRWDLQVYENPGRPRLQRIKREANKNLLAMKLCPRGSRGRGGGKDFGNGTHRESQGCISEGNDNFKDVLHQG